MAEASPAASNRDAMEMILQYFKDFGVLRDNPREYWAVQVVNFLDCAAYFALLNIAVTYLTETVGWGDVGAGYVVTTLTSLVTISLFFTGAITDWLGIRRSLILAVFVQLVSRVGLLAFGLWTDAPARLWVVAGFMVLSGPGVAMTITAFQAANKRFSSRRSRGASFSVWYLVMNFGGVVAGLVIDGVRLKLGMDNSYIFAFAAVCGVLALLAAFGLISREDPVMEDEPEVAPAPVTKREADEGNNPYRAPDSSISEPATEAPVVARPAEKKNPIAIILEVVRQSAFWRLIVFMVAILGVRAAFTYMYLILPKYWVRIIGEQVQMGTLQAINPFCIFIGLILFIPFAGRYNVYKMLLFGAAISASSLLVLVLPWQWFSPDMASGYFRMSIAMLMLLSVGEIIWSPKLNEYAAAIAPKGQEGTYLGMSMMPWFLAKTTVGILSGHMLLRWVPEGTGERIASGELAFMDSPEAMWLYLFMWAAVGLLLAVILKGWLTRGADLDPHAHAK